MKRGFFNGVKCIKYKKVSCRKQMARQHFFHINFRPGQGAWSILGKFFMSSSLITVQNSLLFLIPCARMEEVPKILETLEPILFRTGSGHMGPKIGGSWSPPLYVKVNSATPRRVIGVGAHLFDRWARRLINHGVCDAWPVRRQTYGYLPSLRRYQIYTAWWQLAAQDINPIAYAPEFTWPNFHAQAGTRTQTGTLVRPVGTYLALTASFQAQVNIVRGSFDK